jgi:hypothetical protein
MSTAWGISPARPPAGTSFARLLGTVSVSNSAKKEHLMAAKTKSMIGSDGGLKLASSHGRKKAKSGGEPQKPVHERGSLPRQRTGSSKQRKG